MGDHDRYLWDQVVGILLGEVAGERRRIRNCTELDPDATADAHPRARRWSSRPRPSSLLPRTSRIKVLRRPVESAQFLRIDLRISHCLTEERSAARKARMLGPLAYSTGTSQSTMLRNRDHPGNCCHAPEMQFGGAAPELSGVEQHHLLTLALTDREIARLWSNDQGRGRHARCRAHRLVDGLVHQAR